MFDPNNIKNGNTKIFNLIRRKHNPTLNGKELEHKTSSKKTQDADKHVKDAQHHVAIKEMQTGATRRRPSQVLAWF